MSRHRFVHAFEPDGGPLGHRARERATVDGRDRGGRPALAFAVRRRGEGLRRAKNTLGQVLRPLGLGLFAGALVYPLLYLLLGGGVIAAFAAHVALFFFVLDLWVLLAACVFIAARSWSVRVPFAPGEPNALGLDPASLGAGGASLVGTVERLAGARAAAARKEPVLVDAWGRSAAPRRVVEGDDFVLRPLGDGLPVVVRLESAPVVLGEPSRDAVGRLPLSRAGRAEILSEEAVYIALEEGDRVRVHAAAVDTVPRLDHLDFGDEVRRVKPDPEADDANPYRGAGPGPGRLVRSTAARPLVVVRLPAVDAGEP